MGFCKGRRPRWGAIAVLGLGLGPAARAEVACTPVGPTAEVAAVLDGLELALDDGRVLRLAGVDPARATAERPQLGAEARVAADRWLGGRRVIVQPLASAPDRWDRVTALVALAPPSDGAPPPPADPAPGPSVNAVLIGAGWARARPETPASGCFASFLAREAEARGGRLGLWADPYYAIVRAEDAPGLAQRTGAMAIVAGRLHLRAGGTRTVVTLGPPGSDFAATVSRRAEKTLAKAGIDLQKLTGAEVRIRGFLDDRFGPRIDLSSADQIELAGPPDERPKVARPTREEVDRNR